VGRDWRETVRNAADFALLGIVTAVAALPVVTAGAAVATASAAVHHWADHQSFPDLGTSTRRYVRGILPGAGATLVTALAAWLLVLNLGALRAGTVPGGTPLFTVTAILAVAAAGLAGLIVVQVGRHDGRGWLTAARTALRVAYERPLVLVGATGVVALTGFVGVLVLPLLIPILLGYALVALHAVTRRLTRRD
jgi:hypothetical protein